MQLISFVGYRRPDVDTALSKIMKQSKKHNVNIHGGPISRKFELLSTHPKLWGCDKDDLIVMVLTVDGKKEDIKDLIRTDTPIGVQMELLPHTEAA